MHDFTAVERNYYGFKYEVTHLPGDTALYVPEGSSAAFDDPLVYDFVMSAYENHGEFDRSAAISHGFELVHRAGMHVTEKKADILIDYDGRNVLKRPLKVRGGVMQSVAMHALSHSVDPDCGLRFVDSSFALGNRFNGSSIVQFELAPGTHALRLDRAYSSNRKREKALEKGLRLMMRDRYDAIPDDLRHLANDCPGNLISTTVMYGGYGGYQNIFIQDTSNTDIEDLELAEKIVEGDTGDLVATLIDQGHPTFLLGLSFLMQRALNHF